MKHHGRATISYNGKRLRSKQGASLNLGGTGRTPEPLDDGSVGYVEATVAPELTCAIPLTQDLAVEELQNLVDANIVFESDTGKSWVIREAFTVDTLSVGTEVSLKFSGQPAVAL
ncbi:phage tail tube protein [Pseudomonas anguilliseptica]|uniref:Phage tail tube protein n=1 Tax=Pseudomonas anguilliseptica TaxID=53406 RepID=A0A1H5A5V8_PSEAG|nr:phage tail tube protein [Pseudomonas anguilliseptica]SED37020.1 Phage tail tube protein [Pseudomonas anguilliseptica]